MVFALVGAAGELNKEHRIALPQSPHRRNHNIKSREIKSKGLVVGKTVKNRKCYKIKMGRRKIKSKMFKLKKKTRGVRICKIIKNIQNF